MQKYKGKVLKLCKKGICEQNSLEARMKEKIICCGSGEDGHLQISSQHVRMSCRKKTKLRLYRWTTRTWLQAFINSRLPAIQKTDLKDDNGILKLNLHANGEYIAINIVMITGEIVHRLKRNAN